ncbi:hypothetical protein CROQUDRAFT_652037 [Cronartium quercuum f. sp. fusiforme G11]|uniref:adenine phosphoribosyltransferase n=1 Tax=Cronartium quercuum f. sp. fusiforme G11 TaxID=708437 RepID=A0A9P6TGA7_9BASI|nr:hypothetical protein CROQUDRAFT_652037 [Cronartium quercuum f. sp. fusiforme G11]
MSDVAYLKNLLGVHPDFPQKGIMFLDIFPILRDPAAFETLITHLVHHLTSVTLLTIPSKKIDVVVGLDARGFLLGPVIAMRLNCGFVPIRKKGKLPGKVISAEYVKEYGTDVVEIQADSIKHGQTVVVVDDLIATGGTVKAAEELVEKLGGKVVEHIFVIEASFLKGSERLNAPTYAIIKE